MKMTIVKFCILLCVSYSLGCKPRRTSVNINIAGRTNDFSSTLRSDDVSNVANTRNYVNGGHQPYFISNSEAPDWSPYFLYNSYGSSTNYYPQVTRRNHFDNNDWSPSITHHRPCQECSAASQPRSYHQVHSQSWRPQQNYPPQTSSFSFSPFAPPSPTNVAEKSFIFSPTVQTIVETNPSAVSSSSRNDISHSSDGKKDASRANNAYEDRAKSSADDTGGTTTATSETKTHSRPHSNEGNYHHQHYSVSEASPPSFRFQPVVFPQSEYRQPIHSHPPHQQSRSMYASDESVYRTPVYPTKEVNEISYV